MHILSKTKSFIAGILCGLCFAPVFFWPGIFAISVLAAQVKLSTSKIQAIKFGYFFGFGFYLSTLYWISFGVSVYIQEFWWAIPFALFGLPAFIAIFTAQIALLSWYFRNSKHFYFLFCCFWLLIEWVISWIFTGLPWGVMGYALSNWLVLLQVGSVVGIFGLSFVVVYIGGSFYNFFCNKKDKIEVNSFYIRLIVSVILLSTIVIYGTIRLGNYQTEYTEISARLVQPSIPQVEKWNPDEFWQNLDLQVKLSKEKGSPDIIIWSEAALTAPYHIKSVKETILASFVDDKQILLTGGVTDNGKADDDIEVYSSLIGLDKFGSKILEYHKSHLVPFGEYMPLKSILPLKKITHGLVDYTEGKKQAVFIKGPNLSVWPLICYESIFPYEVIVSNKNIDVIINITNDAWYGNSSGPYQHFEISRMRAIENGLPMMRVANNGISGFIDPLGRVINKTQLNDITIIDEYIPKKLSYETVFSKYGILTLILGVGLVLMLQLIIRSFFKVVS